MIRVERCVYKITISEHLFAVYMSKLYIRYKKEGKWTWRPVTAADILNGSLDTDNMKLVEEEE